MKTMKDLQEKYDELIKQKSAIDAELLMLQGEARLLKEIEESKEAVKEDKKK